MKIRRQINSNILFIYFLCKVVQYFTNKNKNFLLKFAKIRSKVVIGWLVGLLVSWSVCRLGGWTVGQ
jgi:hypothetical protein